MNAMNKMNKSASNESQQLQQQQQPQMFTFPVTGQTVRAIIYEGKPHLVARDVALMLGYARPADAINLHCKKVNKITQYCKTEPSVKCPPTNINIIPESDVYRLIMHSQLPAAVQFQDWVCEEVLPALRRDGGYMLARPEETPEELMLRALRVAQSTIERQKEELTNARPSVVLHNRITCNQTRWTIRHAMDELRVKMKDIHRVLKENKLCGYIAVWNGRRYWANDTMLAAGYAEIYRQDNGMKNWAFTAKGMNFLRNALNIQ